MPALKLSHDLVDRLGLQWFTLIGLHVVTMHRQVQCNITSTVLFIYFLRYYIEVVVDRSMIFFFFSFLFSLLAFADLKSQDSDDYKIRN